MHRRPPNAQCSELDSKEGSRQAIQCAIYQRPNSRFGLTSYNSNSPNQNRRSRTSILDNTTRRHTRPAIGRLRPSVTRSTETRDSIDGLCQSKIEATFFLQRSVGLLHARSAGTSAYPEADVTPALWQPPIRFAGWDCRSKCRLQRPSALACSALGLLRAT
ncbi:hypothetical protein GY45DRAFT_377285 [Cubamyces sp. BRFM 1775]|nr:hypothetical protein GY45DRAFT_377285 [Cubamyces sp. BRFM 1775]